MVDISVLIDSHKEFRSRNSILNSRLTAACPFECSRLDPYNTQHAGSGFRRKIIRVRLGFLRHLSIFFTEDNDDVPMAGTRKIAEGMRTYSFLTWGIRVLGGQEIWHCNIYLVRNLHLSLKCENVFTNIQ